MADSEYAYDPVGTGAVNQQTYRMEAGQLWRQYVIAAIVNLLTVAVGFVLGWTSPINVKLDDLDQSPLPERPTSNQIAWVGSVLTLGAIFGPFLGGAIVSRFGRKWCLLSAALPLLVGWVLVAAATDVAYIYAGRLLWGMTAGMVFGFLPMYCAEIATDEARGALGTFVQSFVTVGFMMVYTIGPFVSYSAVAYVGVAIGAVFCLAFFFMPETPTYHLIKNDREAAARCLSTIRGRSHAGVQAELNTIEAGVRASMSKTATIADVFRGSNFKAFYISVALMFFQQFSGINAVLFYMTDIFRAAGASLDSHIATIIIGAVQMVASFMTPLVVDRLGRRILLMVSCSGTAVGLGLLGMYFLLAEQNSPVIESIGWLPVLSLVLFIVTYCWGLGPLPWCIMSELLPIEVKAAASPIATAINWGLSFVITRYFSSIADALGMYVAFWLFGVCCTCGFFFTLFLVPETKGKSFAEIQDNLAGRTSKPEKS